MGIFSRKPTPRTPHTVTVQVMAQNPEEAQAAAKALQKVCAHFTPAQMEKLAKRLDNPVLRAQLNAFL